MLVVPLTGASMRAHIGGELGTVWSVPQARDRWSLFAALGGTHIGQQVEQICAQVPISAILLALISRHRSCLDQSGLGLRHPVVVFRDRDSCFHHVVVGEVEVV